MRARPSHVIFDLDGTLADSSAGILGSFHATLDSIGLVVDEAVLRQLIGPPLGDSFRALDVPENKIDDVVALYRGFYAERGVHESRLYAGIDSTLRALANEGVRLGVATAKRVDFAQQMLTSLGIAELFDEIAGASVDLRVTSKYYIMSSVLELWGVHRDLDVWMVGDRHFDIAAARLHEVRAVGALWGFGSAEELRDAGAHWLIERPQHLLEFRSDTGSPVCMLDEVCELCGRIKDAAHRTACRASHIARD